MSGDPLWTDGSGNQSSESLAITSGDRCSFERRVMGERLGGTLVLGGLSGARCCSRYNCRVLHGARRTLPAFPAGGASKNRGLRLSAAGLNPRKK